MFPLDDVAAAYYMVAMNNNQAVVQQKHLAKLQVHVIGSSRSGYSITIPHPLSVSLHRIGEGDDSQVFLETFKATAEVCQRQSGHHNCCHCCQGSPRWRP